MADTNGDILNCHQGLYELQGYGCLGIRRLVRENMHGNQLNSTGKNGIEGMADNPTTSWTAGGSAAAVVRTEAA